MITRLIVENFAIIDRIEVTFQEGFNVITGETGAGKSIVIEALGLALGERGNTDMIRTGTNRTIVECEASVSDTQRPQIQSILEAEDIPGEFPLIMRRELRNNGRSRAFINDTPCTVQVLKGVGDLVVDMHGQHEHQSLLDSDVHITFLDEYLSQPDLLETVREKYQGWNEVEAEFKALKKRQRELSEKEDLYKFQLKEINSVKPNPGEMDELEQERKILSNSQRIAELVQQLQQMLYEGDSSVYDQLVMAEHNLRELANIDDSVSEYADECNSATVTVKEIGNYLNRYGNDIENEPGRLNQIEERIVALRKLMKKYGPSLEDVLAYRDKIQSQLDDFESFDAEIKRLSRKKTESANQLADACESLHKARTDAANQMADSIEEILHTLGMENSSFRVNVEYRTLEEGDVRIDETPVQVDKSGADDIEFYVTTNPGEGEKPLAQIASGGEISRTMLAIKSVLAGKDGISSVIFDEIDIGISGRISRIVAEQLRSLAKYHQVLCITHLPQIASLGDTHYVVRKQVTGDRTSTEIRPLEYEERIEEIASLVGGTSISETTLQNARELLQRAND
ncbi:MAG: DNA repair protein RecN [Candidatus Marinimicrobia bacterium]|nr:DNA repair protein RecN [Candidatus Neomarinimicrobiota bacterium]MCF7880280.1 DNA repair protein RecN [Candidatus Neomarinimicrobiota bacterium]